MMRRVCRRPMDAPPLMDLLVLLAVAVFSSFSKRGHPHRADVFVDKHDWWYNRWKLVAKNDLVEEFDTAQTDQAYTNVSLIDAKINCLRSKDCIGFHRINVRTALPEEVVPTRNVTLADYARSKDVGFVPRGQQPGSCLR